MEESINCKSADHEVEVDLEMEEKIDARDKTIYSYSERHLLRVLMNNCDIGKIPKKGAKLKFPFKLTKK